MNSIDSTFQPHSAGRPYPAPTISKPRLKALAIGLTLLALIATASLVALTILAPQGEVDSSSAAGAQHVEVSLPAPEPTLAAEELEAARAEWYARVYAGRTSDVPERMRHQGPRHPQPRAG